MESEENKSVKVKDNRRFDQQGNERGEGAAPTDVVKPEVSSASIAATSAGEGEGSEETVTFSSFVMSLATQALMQLGQMPPPPGLDIRVDREAARQTIDILSLMQNKTKGNLDVSEAQLMEDILHNLRMAYVKGV